MRFGTKAYGAAVFVSLLVLSGSTTGCCARQAKAEHEMMVARVEAAASKAEEAANRATAAARNASEAAQRAERAAGKAEAVFDKGLRK